MNWSGRQSQVQQMEVVKGKTLPIFDGHGAKEDALPDDFA